MASPFASASTNSAPRVHGLLLHLRGQISAGNPAGEAREILYLFHVYDLIPAHHMLYDHRPQPVVSGIRTRGEARCSGSNDKNVALGRQDPHLPE